MLLECRPVIKDCSRCHFKPLVQSLMHQQTSSFKNIKHQPAKQLFPPPYCLASLSIIVIHTSTLANEDFIPGNEIYSLIALQ